MPRASARKPEPLQLPDIDVTQLHAVSEENQQAAFEPSGITAAVPVPLERKQLGQILDDDEEAEEDNMNHDWKRYDIAVESEVGPSVYHQTKA